MSPEIGALAPDFSLQDQRGRRESLATLTREQPALLVFFPFAFSGVCSGELLTLRDGAQELAATGVRVAALSCDSMFTLRVLADRDGLELPLLSDFWPHGEVARRYGVFDDRHGCPTRSTFLVDRDGVVRWSVHNPMGEARSVVDYLREARALGPAPSADAGR